MQVIIKNSVTVFDVDDTLALWPKDFRINKVGRVEFEYGEEKVYLEEHSYHTMFLKHCFNRGDYVIVWSANGSAWAEKVVKAFGLDKHVDIVIQKPSRHIDDKTNISSIIGNHIFVPHEIYKG